MFAWKRHLSLLALDQQPVHRIPPLSKWATHCISVVSSGLIPKRVLRTQTSSNRSKAQSRVCQHSSKPLVERCPSIPESIRLTAEHQKHQVLSKVLRHIDQHFCESIDQKTLAQRCGMTPFRFSRVFKEVVGIGFMDYVLNKRMDFAKELLDNSQMPITSIAMPALARLNSE